MNNLEEVNIDRINAYKFKITVIDPDTMKVVDKSILYKIKFYIDSEGYLKALVHHFDNTNKKLIIKYDGR